MPQSSHLLKRSCRNLYIYSKRLPPSLHLLKMVAAISTSTQNGCHHLYIYSKRLPPSLHLLKTCRCDNCRPKKRREHFLIDEIRRIDGMRGFQTNRNVLRIGGNTFYDWKNEIPMKILEFKRSGIRIIAEFCVIQSGFPNQAVIPSLVASVRLILSSCFFSTPPWGFHGI